MYKIFEPITSFFRHLYRYLYGLIFPPIQEPFARIQIQPGHKLWKWDKGQVTAVGPDDYVESEEDEDGNTVRKLMVKEGVKYVSALNQRNALRKFSQDAL